VTRAHFKTHYNRGTKLANRHKFSDAILAFETALVAKPNDVDTIFQLGNVSKAMHFYDIAIKWYDIALQLHPSSTEIAFNRALALQLTGRNQDALNAYSILAPSMPDHPMLWNNLGTLYQQMSMTVEAIKALEKAVALKPNYGEAWNNLGLSYFVARAAPEYAAKWLGAFKKAEKQHRGEPGFHVNRATCHFWSGHYNEGWADYEHRHHPKLKQSVIYNHKIPWWKGEDLTGKTLLIGEEQGIGDQITFTSALAEIAATAHKVILEVNPKIVELMQRNFPSVCITAPKSETIDMKRHHHYDWLDTPVDYFAPQGSAFFHTRPSLDAFPCQPSFLKADPAQARHWRERLKALGSKRKVGLSWRGAHSDGGRQGAYFDLKSIAPFLEKMTDFQFINLQYGDCSDEISACKPRADGTDILTSFDDLDLFDDIEGTCALIDSLDFVISVRNSQACFAGALGKRVISYYGSFFQFGRKYTDPVYPNMLTVYPHADELPISEQFEAALLDFDGTYKLYSERSGELK